MGTPEQQWASVLEGQQGGGRAGGAALRLFAAGRKHKPGTATGTANPQEKSTKTYSMTL